MMLNQTDWPYRQLMMFRMILNSFIHIIDTEGNITCEVRESYYKKYWVYVGSGNIGIAICTTATLTKFYTIFLGTPMKYTWNWKRPV